MCDNCRDLKNPDQSDSNKNAIWDVCEDVDMDSIIWWRDNCPFAANEDQKDSDNNGIGDACSDIDGDSIFDSLDNCETFYNEDIECRLDSIREIQLLLEEEIQILNELIE